MKDNNNHTIQLTKTLNNINSKKYKNFKYSLNRNYNNNKILTENT